MDPKHEVRVSTRGSDREIAKAYSRMERHAGKGDAPRSIFSRTFRENYDRIFGHRQPIFRRRML